MCVYVYIYLNIWIWIYAYDTCVFKCVWLCLYASASARVQYVCNMYKLCVQLRSCLYEILTPTSFTNILKKKIVIKVHQNSCANCSHFRKHVCAYVPPHMLPSFATFFTQWVLSTLAMLLRSLRNSARTRTHMYIMYQAYPHTSKCLCTHTQITHMHTLAQTHK